MSGKNIKDGVPIKNIPKEKRIAELANIFHNKFGDKPSFYVRVPGRVNIIGEHIDYCGYPVLPMALEQDILIAVKKLKEPKLQIKNVNGKYNDYEIKLKTFESIIIECDPEGKPYWYNYVLCGVKGALEHLENKMISGLQILILGNIPPASGLSSSSALVSAACLSFLFAQDKMMSQTDIASLCASSERYIGTQGGGMDQAIAFLAEKNCAQYITWNPLKATRVTLPENAAFVVAHSLAEANKAATNDFNRRVIECRLAAKVLAKYDCDHEDTKIITLSQVQNLLSKSLEDMVQLVLRKLTKDIYTKADICEILQIHVKELESLYLTPDTKHLQEFKLKQRALHVYEEALRVEKFREICTENCHNGLAHSISTNRTKVNGAGLPEKDNLLQVLGELMSASHESLKNLYECSHKNLDKLVDISKSKNVHARLTGAGWGGCIVALCPKDQLVEYIETLKAEFYNENCKNNTNEPECYVFATSPNYGAVIYTEIYN